MLSCQRVEISLACRRCGDDVVASGLDAMTLCGGCSAPVEVWGALGPALAHDVLPLDHMVGGLQQGRLPLPGGQLRWWSERPMCPGCGVSVDPARLLQAHLSAPSKESVACPRCLAALRVRTPTEPLRKLAPSLLLVLDEKRLKPRAGAPRADCSRCRKPLSLAPPVERRVVECGACGTQNRLDDDTWVGLQPGDEGRHFYVVYDEDAVYARALVDAELDIGRRLQLLERAPLPEAPLAGVIADLQRRAAEDDAQLQPQAQAQWLALACNRRVPVALVQSFVPASSEEAAQWWESREDLPVERALALLDAPLQWSGDVAVAALERQQAWRDLARRAPRGVLSEEEARLLLRQPHRPDLAEATARNPLLPKELLSELSRDDRWQRAVVENPAVSVGLLQALSSRAVSEDVRRLAAAHPRHPRSFWQRLMGRGGAAQ